MPLLLNKNNSILNMKTILKNRAFWFLLIICCITLFPILGLPEYHTKGEPREAVVSYSMLATDNWTLPRNNGGEMAYKPPFFHWCVAVVSSIWGTVTEATSRIPSAIALIIMSLCGFCFYQKRRNTRIALLAALIAFTSFELHRAGANCRVDMVLTVLTVCSLYLLYKWYENGLRGIPLLAILLMGLGTLTKGPVGSIIPCMVIGGFMLLRGVNFFKTFFLLFAWGLLSLIPYAIWFYFAWQQGGQEFLDLMYEENIGRMTNTMGYNSCVEPWYYNFITVFAGYVPWTLMLLISLFFLRYHRPVIAGWWQRFTQWIREMRDVDLYSLTAIILIFVFYCIPQSKRSVYLMPIYPFIAYFIALYIEWLEERKKSVVKIYGGILAVLSILLFTCFLAVKGGLVPESIFGTGHHAADNVLMLQALQQISHPMQWIIISVPLVLGLVWFFFLRQKNIWGVLLLTFGLYLSLDAVYTPTVLNTKSVKAVSAALDSHVPANMGTLYEYIEEGVKAKGDPVHFFEVNFYLGNRIESFHLQKPTEGFLLISKTDAEHNMPEFQQEGYQMELFYELGKREMQVYKFKKTAP